MPFREAVAVYVKHAVAVYGFQQVLLVVFGVLMFLLALVVSAGLL